MGAMLRFKRETGKEKIRRVKKVMSAISIQPHTKKKITPKQLLQMPWDHEKTKRSAQDISPEQQRNRFEELKERLSR